MANVDPHPPITISLKLDAGQFAEGLAKAQGQPILFAPWCAALGEEIAAAKASAAELECLAELALEGLGGDGQVFHQLVRLRVVGQAAGGAGDLRVALEVQEPGRLLMAALRTVRADLDALQVQLHDLVSPSVGCNPAGDAESADPSTDGSAGEVAP